MPSPTDSFPALGAFAVTPSDSANFTRCRALYIGTGGNVVVVFAESGEAITFTNVQSGTILPVQAKRVNSTNTTASNIVALQ